AVQLLNASPPQVMIEIKFAEIDSSELRALGLDPASDMKESDLAVTATDWNGVVTDPRAFEPGNLIQYPVDRKPELRPGKARLFTASQMRALLKRLERAAGDVLVAPRVSTLSGRQAQIQVIEVKDVVLLQDFKAGRLATGSFIIKSAPIG